MALQNGALDGALLLGAAGSSGARLRFGTAARWARIRNEVHAEFGWWPEVTSAGDGYRTLTRQIELFKRNYTTTNTGHGPAKGYEGVLWWRRTAGTPSAAVPGRSNHGFGTTVDVEDLGGLNQFTTTRYKQFAAVAARHGFSNAEGRLIGEPWHWSDTKNPDDALGAPAPPTTTTPEDDMPLSPADLSEIHGVVYRLFKEPEIVNITAATVAEQIRVADIGRIARDAVLAIFREPEIANIIRANSAASVGGTPIDYTALAKAVNDDAARRLAQ